MPSRPSNGSPTSRSECESDEKADESEKLRSPFLRFFSLLDSRLSRSYERECECVDSQYCAANVDSTITPIHEDDAAG